MAPNLRGANLASMWASPSRDTHPPNHPTTPKARRLEYRLKVVQSACNVATMLNDEKQYDTSALHKELSYLKGIAQDFPSPIKQKLLAARLRALVPSILKEGSDEDMQILLDSLNPFATTTDNSTMDDCAQQHHDPSVASPFDPLAPTMSSLDGTMLNKAVMAKRIFIHDLMRPLIDGGEAMSMATMTLCKRMALLIEENIEQLEEIPAPVEELLQACRAMATLIDTRSSLAHAADIELLSSAAMAGHNSKAAIAIVDLALLVRPNEFYSGLLDTFMSFLASSKEVVPEVQNAVEQLQDCDDGDSTAVAYVGEALSQLPRWRAKVRPGATYEIESLCQEKLERYGLLILKEDDTPMTEERLASMSIFRDVLGQGVAIWPQATELCTLKASLEKATAAHDQSLRIASLRRALLHHLDHDLPFNNDGFKQNDLVNIANKCAGIILTNDADIEVMRLFLDKKFETAYADLMHASPNSQLLPTIASLMPEAAASQYTRHIRLLEATYSLVLAKATMMNLNEDLDNILETDSNFNDMRTVMHASCVLDEARQHCNVDDVKGAAEAINALRSDCSTMISKVAEISHVKAKQALVVASRSPATWCHGGASGKPWHDSISEKSSLAKVLQIAKETLMKIPAKQFRTAAADIKTAYEKYDMVCGFFSLDRDEPVIQQAMQTASRCLLSSYEGLLVQLFSSEDMQGMALKRKVLGIQASCDAEANPAVEWDSMQPELLKRATAAKRLR